MAQRPPQLGDWTVCQDKETTKTSIRVNDLDSINRLNVLDWAIADCKQGKDLPYLYVPNRVYAMDTVILKDTLEGLMPIPENKNAIKEFEPVTTGSALLAAKAGTFSCSTTCKWAWSDCFKPEEEKHSSKCSIHADGTLLPLGIGVWGYRSHVDITIRSVSAFEYVDLRITNWGPGYATQTSGAIFFEDDRIGWTKIEGETFKYDKIARDVYRIWAWPGKPGGRWGPYGTQMDIRIEYTLLYPYLIGTDEQFVFYPEFEGAERDIKISLVGAGRRGNHR